MSLKVYSEFWKLLLDKKKQQFSTQSRLVFFEAFDHILWPSSADQLRQLQTSGRCVEIFLVNTVQYVSLCVQNYVSLCVQSLLFLSIIWKVYYLKVLD